MRDLAVSNQPVLVRLGSLKRRSQSALRTLDEIAHLARQLHPGRLRLLFGEQPELAQTILRRPEDLLCCVREGLERVARNTTAPISARRCGGRPASFLSLLRRISSPICSSSVQSSSSVSCTTP